MIDFLQNVTKRGLLKIDFPVLDFIVKSFQCSRNLALTPVLLSYITAYRVSSTYCEALQCSALEGLYFIV